MRLFKDTITFQKNELVKGEFGETKDVWVDSFSARCESVFKSGNRTIENDEILHIETKEFIIRSYHKVTHDMRIVFEGESYRILSINKSVKRQSQSITTEVINI